MTVADVEGYSRVLVEMGHGSSRSMSRAEFEELPLSERIELILTKRAQFFLHGKPVSSRVALKRA